jgi:hypothetical protein
MAANTVAAEIREEVMGKKQDTRVWRQEGRARNTVVY